MLLAKDRGITDSSENRISITKEIKTRTPNLRYDLLVVKNRKIKLCLLIIWFPLTSSEGVKHALGSLTTEIQVP